MNEKNIIMNNENKNNLLINNIDHEIESLIYNHILDSIDYNDFNINNIDIDQIKIEMKDSILKSILKS